jgi:hypothetical protein
MGVAATADRNAKVQEQSPDGGPASARRQFSGAVLEQRLLDAVGSSCDF